MADFASLTSNGRSVVLDNIINNSTSSALPEYSSAVVAIEALNDVISGDSTDSLAGAIAAVRDTLDLGSNSRLPMTPLMVVLALALLMHRRKVRWLRL